MRNLLYYPYINVPRADWTLRTLLYYDKIGSIVPYDFLYNPDKLEPFMRDLIKKELVTQINPMDVLQDNRRFSDAFINYIKSKDFNLEKRVTKFKSKENISNSNLKLTNIHSDKFDHELFYQLKHAGLAEKNENNWYRVESKTANDLMSFLATVIGDKLDYLPTTDIVFRKVPFTSHKKKVYKTIRNENTRREIILKELIPFPEQIEIDLLRKFKDKHQDLLQNFQFKIEKIALDKYLDEESSLFKYQLEELNFRKEELKAKMNESNFENIFFGTVCGLVGATVGFASTDVKGSIAAGVAAVPSFLNAIHSALNSGNEIDDNYGLKYLSLVDKKLRTKNK